MSRGTSAAERGQINKKRKTDYLNSQLSKLQSKLKNTTDTKSRQRLKQSISSIKKQLDTSPKSYIKSKFEKVKTSRGLKIRPKKTEKPSTIEKVKYPVYKGKVEEKKVEEKKTSGVGPVKDGKTYAKNLKNTTQGIGPVKDGSTYGKNLTKKVVEKKPVEKKKDKLKVNYRRTKGEGIEGKSKGYRGDTRITKKLKKSGFTETRLAALRKKNAEFQAAKKDKKKMKAYREKYGKR